MTLPASQPNYFDSSEVGAPSLNNVAGSLLEIVRACGINGFNSNVVTSIVAAGGVATATAASHNYTATYGKLLLIDGAPEALLNGRKQPLSVTTNTFTFAAPGVADGTYTGTMSAKRAPLGLVELHTGTNKAIFGRSAPEATAVLMRVDDSNSAPATATSARVLMVESATNVDTYVDPSPTVAQLTGGGAWYKGANSATAKKWALVGNDRFFWLINPSASNTAPFDAQMYHFGDGVPYRTPDPYLCTLASSTVDSSTANTVGGSVSQTYATPASYLGSTVARNFSGSAKSLNMHKAGASGSGVLGGDGTGQFGSDVVSISRIYHLLDSEVASAGGHIRGEAPGLAGPLARIPFQASGQFAVITPDVGDGRRYLNVLFSSGGTRANALIDLTGPWF